jgi:hypothetical protein
MNEIRWTSIPYKEGYYWFKYQTSPSLLQIANIYKIHDTLWVDYDGRAWTLEEFCDDILFWGPIPIPGADVE